MSSLPSPAMVTSPVRVRARGVAGALALLALTLVPASASAQVDNVFSFNAGYFALRDMDSRGEDDVLYRNLDFLAFDHEDMNGFTFGGDWGVGVGRYLELVAGAGYYQGSTDSVYWDLVDEDGTEIWQELKLRVVPMTFGARIFPIGRDIPIQPYVGGGLGVFAWRYSESGEWVDETDYSIFRGTFVDDGVALGPVGFAGVRFGSGPLMFTTEFRYQWAEGDLDGDEGFAGSKIDLGGSNWLFGLAIKF